MEYFSNNARGYILFIAILLLCGCTEFNTSDEHRLMKKLIDNYHKNREKDFFTTHAYYYEAAYLKGELAAFSDALGVLMHLGDDFEVPLNSYVFLPHNIRKSDHNSSWDKIIKQSIQHGHGPEARSGFAPGISYLLNALRRVELHGPLNIKNISDYHLSNHIYMDSVAYLEFNPKDEGCFSGRFFYNPSIYQIDSISFDSSCWYSSQHNQLVRGWLTITNREDKGKFRYESIWGGYKRDDINFLVKINTLKNDVELSIVKPECYNSFLTYSINPMINYQESIWNKFDAQIRNMMSVDIYEPSKRETMQNQFMGNHDKPFYTYIHQGIDYPDPIKLANTKKELEKLFE